MKEDLKQISWMFVKNLTRLSSYIIFSYPLLWMIDWMASKSEVWNAQYFYCDGTDWYWKPLVLGFVTYLIFG